MSSSPGEDPRHHAELTGLYEVCQTLCSTLDIRHSFASALHAIASRLGLRAVMLVLPNAQGELVTHSSAGLTEAQAQRGIWHRGEGVVGEVFASGLPSILGDVSRAPTLVHRTGAFRSDEVGQLAFIAVPVRAEQAVLGVLAAACQGQDHNSHLLKEQRILTMIATLLAHSMQLHQVTSSEHQRWQREARHLHKALVRERPAHFEWANVIGQSEPMQKVYAEVHQAAPTKATVLLRGESGTGKEVIAQSVHHLSPRGQGPFVAVNCAAISETLLESELFGHERGAFTGAISERKGRFEQAHLGSLFLDEIGDISASFQSKLLRVLQEREFERVGGNKPVKVDVRLICATNRDLEQMVQRGEFRSDLYFRINVIPIYLPPLRDRRADIPALVSHFVDRFNKENQRRLRMTPEALDILMSCQWPGNVRELQNCIERAATMAPSDTIEAADVACQQNSCLTKTLHHFNAAGPPVSEPNPACSDPPDAGRSAVTGVDEPANGDERERLLQALVQARWVQSKAARLLNISPRQLAYALHKHDIPIRKY